jgi:hypothetical protein
LSQSVHLKQQVTLNDTKLPILFLQLGSNTSLFFDKVLKQAALTNGRENVFILTDTNFQLYNDYNCIDISSYAQAERPFDKLYKHHSTNTYFFEKTCLDRWFIINDVIRDLNIDHFVYADCDVLVLQDLKPVYDSLIKNKYDGTMMFFENGDNSITSAHTSFWNTKLLNDFCHFINDKYADDAAFNVLLKNTLAGKFYHNTNVSDMILLSVFRTEIKPHTLDLLSLEGKGICFDFNINVSYNGCRHSFVLAPGIKIKKMIPRNNSLYGLVQNGDRAEYFKFYTLHFQGYLTKSLIPIYVTSDNFFNFLYNSISGRAEYIKRRAKLLKNYFRNFIKS